MKMMIVENCAAQMELSMYETLNDNARKHPCLTRSSCVLVALGDTLIETLKLPLEAIEGLALAIINLLGVILCAENWTIKGFLLNTEKMATCAGRTPVAALLAPFKFIYQTVAILSDPREAAPYWNGASQLSNVEICEKMEDYLTKCVRAF